MSEPAIDPVVFSEMQELMEEALGEFIITYLENSPKLIQLIGQGLSGDVDMELVYQNAHQLKGGSGSIGAMKVFQLSKEIEEMARSSDPAGLESLFQQLQQAFEQAADELKTHI